jgi:hypothetical protein
MGFDMPLPMMDEELPPLPEDMLEEPEKRRAATRPAVRAP